MAWAHLLFPVYQYHEGNKLSLNPRLLFRETLFCSSYFLAMFFGVAL